MLDYNRKPSRINWAVILFWFAGIGLLANGVVPAGGSNPWQILWTVYVVAAPAAIITFFAYRVPMLRTMWSIVFIFAWIIVTLAYVGAFEVFSTSYLVP